MSYSKLFSEAVDCEALWYETGARSHSAQGLVSNVSSPGMKIPLPPRMWITDAEDDSSDEMGSISRDDGSVSLERVRVRSRFRHLKPRSVNVPLGIFWDIENCQVPRDCSAIDVVAAIRSKFLTGRREADFVVVCDVRKESASRLQELNDAQVSLIHVCGTQKNAADEKLRQCMRRFGELHPAPASLLLISGDINFAADLSDFRHRKNMEVILVHQRKTSPALIACASSHYCYNELTVDVPRKTKTEGGRAEARSPCELEVCNLPREQPAERVSRRLRRLADNCGGKVLRVHPPTALLRFPTPDHASRALKRMDGEDVFGRKISTRFVPSALQPTYSSDEGYGTATASVPPPRPAYVPNAHPVVMPAQACGAGVSEWALALQQLPALSPRPRELAAPPAPPAHKPRKIRGTHGSVGAERSGRSSSNSGDEVREVRETRARESLSRAASPWNSSSVSEHSDAEPDAAELTVTNLPPYEPALLQEMLTQLFSQYVPVIRVSVWSGAEGPLASILLRSEWDARLVIARVHKRRLDSQWTGRRLELSLGRPSPAPNLDVLRARLRAILLDQQNHTLPLLRLRDAYASRHCCALTASDIAKVKDTVIIHEGFGKMVQLVDLTPVTTAEMEEAPWKCHIHASLSTGHEDGSRILLPVYMEVAALEKNVRVLLEKHGGVLPLLSFVECYEAMFSPLLTDTRRGVSLELLLRTSPAFEVKDTPSRHLTWRSGPEVSLDHTGSLSESSRSSGERERPRTAPALEPMLALFERELVDLLRTAPRCSIPFSKLIPAFHHHFGRQCRVADYGFTKLPDLLTALGNTIVVLGSGSSRVITLSAAAQARRWTSDVVKMLKAAPKRALATPDVPALYQATFGRVFSPADYGLCSLPELMRRVSPHAVVTSPDGTISLPRRTPTPEERARTIQFAEQAKELLSFTANLRMEFSSFVPAYHAHFGRQLRVAHYGCVKLAELLELVGEWLCVCAEPGGARTVRVCPRVARGLLARRLRAIGHVPFGALPALYATRYGASPLPDMLEVETLEELVFAAGGCVERGMVLPPGGAPHWAGAVLAACAALAADRSVARGSSPEYFAAACRRLGADVAPRALRAAGVLSSTSTDASGLGSAPRLRLAPAWRTVWRVAQLLAERNMSAAEILHEYTQRYDPNFPWPEPGPEGVAEFLRTYSEIFAVVEGGWSLCAGVELPSRRDAPAVPDVDYSVYDTPPGQKGSRVFESPKTHLWGSPPASALPTPSALLTHEKRRTRLAAQFDAS
ncbi:meiosis regulator and mRNA stability factor 1 [Manduca sexta]|uniref:meiosis regulator and mRNA stability factor 1 n=1 Tax=Manduca sexta TaxID=7130 RepID=UPI00188F0C52|nr:meiosis regulator and mRNA stability factor 1 [Manduca sexta]